jgi:membrane-associated HD superfamily phosphohydrolase
MRIKISSSFYSSFFLVACVICLVKKKKNKGKIAREQSSLLATYTYIHITYSPISLVSYFAPLSFEKSSLSIPPSHVPSLSLTTTFPYILPFFFFFFFFFFFLLFSFHLLFFFLLTYPVCVF